jgi:hypothetical protein
MLITHNNHFQFGWGDDVFNTDNKFGEFWTKYGRAEYIPTSFREECVRAAKLIAESTNRPLLLCLSGGINSEIMARSFIEAGVPFEVVILNYNYRFTTCINDHETKHAVQFVIENNLTCHQATLDIEDYFKNSLPELCSRYKTNKLSKLIVCEIIKQFPTYHCVMGGDEMLLQRHRTNGRPGRSGVYAEEELVNIAAIETAANCESTISSRFFIYTPEIMLSYLLNSTVTKWIKYENALQNSFVSVNAYANKIYVGHDSWPDMQIRTKYTGFERIVMQLNYDRSINEVIRLFLENTRLYKRIEFIIDHDKLLEWLTPENITVNVSDNVISVSHFVPA